MTNQHQGSQKNIVLVIAVAVLGIGAFSFAYFTRENTDSATSTSKQSNNILDKIAIENFQFTRLPFDVENIGAVAPVGEFAGISRQSAAVSHFAGNYRHYIFSKEPGKRAYNVYAPADAYITAFRNDQTTGEFRFDFPINNSGAFFFLDHIQTLSDEIKAKLAPSFGNPPRFTTAVEQVSPPIMVKAGELLGTTGLKGIAWDWGVMDPNKCEGILKPENYKQDMCPQSVYEYLPTELQTQLRPLAGDWSDPTKGGDGLRPVVTEPILGRYGNDKVGTLSGAWFQKPGSWENAMFYPDPYLAGSLQTRLAIPELSVFGVFNKIIIGAKGVNPNPITVTPNSGIVAYILGKNNQRDTSEYGILLVRVNADESITLETIADTETIPTNLNFSANAVTIQR